MVSGPLRLDKIRVPDSDGRQRDRTIPQRPVSGLLYNGEGAFDHLESLRANNGPRWVDARPKEQLNGEIEFQADACCVERLAESYRR